jgi:hypothetical protein
MRPGPKTRSLADRFQGKFDLDASGCWLWTASTGRGGYGKIYLVVSNEPYVRRLISAHVASYMIHVGPVPSGKEIDHVCRVKLCVNPAHLEAVTHAENLARSHASGGAHQLQRQVVELEALTTRTWGCSFDLVTVGGDEGTGERILIIWVRFSPPQNGD